MPSLYIPRVSTDYSTEDIINTFHLMYIGNVNRVDIGDYSDDYAYMSVFVHIDTLYDSKLAFNIVNRTHRRNNGCYKLYVNEIDYWKIFKNLNPIRETHMNIHQLSYALTCAENKIDNLRYEFESELEKKNNDIYRLTNVVQKLVNTVYPMLDADSYQLKNRVSCTNMLNYGVWYDKSYLPVNTEERERIIKKYMQIQELSEAEPWDDLGDILSSCASTVSEPISTPRIHQYHHYEPEFEPEAEPELEPEYKDTKKTKKDKPKKLKKDKPKKDKKDKCKDKHKKDKKDKKDKCKDKPKKDKKDKPKKEKKDKPKKNKHNDVSSSNNSTDSTDSDKSNRQQNTISLCGNE